ncbi:MAG: ChaN family lipoprotein [Myxococcales bacterium]
MKSLLLCQTLLALATLALPLACGGAQRTNLLVPSDRPRAWVSTLSVNHPLVGHVYRSSPPGEVTHQTLLDTLASKRYVLIGEKHDNPDHHRFQATLLRSIVSRGRKTALVVEMLDVGQQSEVDAVRAAHPHDVDALPVAVQWDKSGWPDWSMYKPIFEVAVFAGLPIVAGNYDHAKVKPLFLPKGLSLDASTKARLGVDRPFTKEQQASLEEELRQSHCGMLSERMLPPMVLVQRLRDGQMAERMRAADRGDGAVLIAGDGHVRTDRGVPHVLRQAGVDAAQIVSIGIFEVNDKETDAQTYGGPQGASVDFMLFTPRYDDKDPCEGFRRR